MSKIYIDDLNKTAITMPESFIDVKTGESHLVSTKIEEQIGYHAENNTLIHLILSALTRYLHPDMINGGTEEILFELSEIKRMIQQAPIIKNNAPLLNNQEESTPVSVEVDLKDLEEVLDAFGG